MNQAQEFSDKILIVDDVDHNLQVLSTILAQQNYTVWCAKNADKALLEVHNNLPDLILLDINLLEVKGYQVWEQLQADEATRSIPVIFLGDPEDELEDKLKAFRIGVDLIGKPFQVEEVLARVKNQLALQQAKAEIKALNEKLARRVKEHIHQVESANLILKAEILQRDQLEQKLRHDALHDSLTGLANRSLLMQEIQKCLDNAIAHPNQEFAILFIDLDRFKIINDSLGHLAGDELLIACARRLQKCITEQTILARLGGDEFTILLKQIKNVQDAVVIAEKILQEFAAPFNFGSRYLIINVSIGIVVGNSEYRQEINLLRDADTALYKARELGKNRYEIFTQQMYLDAMRRLELENELRQAIASQELVLGYQSIVNLDNSELTGFEALVRWEHPQRGTISPEEFIPLAEETGLIIPLGEWVLYEACQQLKIWHELPGAKYLTMSINVAGEQLHAPNFLDVIDRILDQTQVNSQYLKLEITESMLIQDTEQLIEVLEQLKNRQIKLSIDDFGTGYSSLSYLPQFPIDILKIDRSFVQAMNEESQNLEIVKTIITLAQVLKMQIIAEGIETEVQSSTLKALKVEFGQGLLFSPALSLEQAQTAIARLGVNLS
jgi:diguanylate cyclase (GGDEF)-like protein